MILERAIAIAADAHSGQLDKAGVPYILHPLRVMLAVSPRSRVVAVLHDVIEDTDYDPERLRPYPVTLDPSDAFAEYRLSQAEWGALWLVTRPHEGDERRPGWRTTYREFIARIAEAPGEAGEIAREVKRADIRDNLGRLTPELAGMERRYSDALDALACAPVCETCGRRFDATSPDCPFEHRAYPL